MRYLHAVLQGRKPSKSERGRFMLFVSYLATLVFGVAFGVFLNVPALMCGAWAVETPAAVAMVGALFVGGYAVLSVGD